MYSSLTTGPQTHCSMDALSGALDDPVDWAVSGFREDNSTVTTCCNATCTVREMHVFLRMCHTKCHTMGSGQV